MPLSLAGYGGGVNSFLNVSGESENPVGQKEYTTPGTYSWTAPAGVTSVSVVCVGAGAGCGGALAYKNNITVVPGNTYSVVVGSPGVSSGAGNGYTVGGDSSFTATHGTTTAQGGKGTGAFNQTNKGAPAGSYDGGGNGGTVYVFGGYNGGGAGGYSGDGGSASIGGSGGGGTGGAAGAGGWAYWAGGGVGLLGEGASGGSSANQGNGGSGGEDGQGEGYNGANSRTGGNYGGGGSGRWSGNTGGNGAVRIVWGQGRSYPSTNVGNIGATVLTNNLILHLDAGDSNSYSGSGNTWTDLSGEGHNATINGATYNTGNGGYFDFDGTNDYINVGDTGVLPTGTNQFTYSAWVYIDIISSAWGTNKKAASLFTGDTNGTVECGLFTSSSTSGPPVQLVMAMHGGPNTGACTPNISMNLSKWYHVTVVKDGASSQVVYIDGVSAGTGNLSNSFSANSMKIGGAAATGSPYAGWLDGRIGMVSMYNTALSSSQVLQNYNATKYRFIPDIITDNLVLHLDAANSSSYSGSGTTWTDISTQSINGTIDGSTYNSGGGYFDFDGTNDNVKVPLTGEVNDALFSGSNNFTVEFWFKADNLNASGASDFKLSQCLLGGGNRQIIIVFGNFYDDKEVGVRVNMGGGSWSGPVGSGVDSIQNDTWYNLIVTYDSSSGFVLYLNGDQKSTSSLTGTVGTPSSPFDSNNQLLGCVKDDTSNVNFRDRFFDGKISICRIYNKVLTAAEVTQNFDATKGRYL